MVKRRNRSKIVWLITLWVWMVGVGLLALSTAFVQAQDDGQADGLVIYIQAEGPVTPAMVSYVKRGVRIAQDRDAVALVIRLDTPGGQVNLTQDIISALRESRVPVVVHVAPRGAAAWSAGTFITLAAHAAAMAPETGIGAASPVSGTEEPLPKTEELKAKEAVRSLIRDLAARRGEKVVEWAEAAVDEAVAATASEAYEIGLIDFIANDLDDLLTQLNGFEVEVLGERVVLRTAGARVDRVPMSLIEQILHIVVNPTIVFILFTIGVQAIFIEISNPGGWVAGFIGIVSLALGVYGVGVLPVNLLGLVLIALALGLFVMEIKAVTHGALTAAGVASLIAGALILFNSGGAPGYARISLPVVIVVALCFGGTFLFIMTKALQAQRLQPKTGMEGLVGATGEVRVDLDPKGTVFVQGERWKAVTEDGETLSAGEQVEIVAVEDFCLRVIRKT